MGWLANLYWSDWSQSSVGLVVSNSPGVGLNPFCLDPMYQYFIHPTNGGQITVTITNLPTDVYDLFVYATRASEAGAPVIELLRNGTSLWKKATTYWGRNWYASPWDEHEQYVRFRNIAVTNQTLALISYADAAGYASLSGLQIVPSDALPSEAPNIVKLLNINFPGNTPDKVGYAAVGQTTNDFWNERPNATSGATTSLKLADSTTTGAGVIVRNAAGNWGFVTVPDLMYQNYIYGGNGGNTTIILTNLPSGTCDFYIYGHTTNYPDNAIFELWSDGVNWGTKGTSIHGPGPATTNWQVGQQFVLFKGVAVSSNAPVIIHAKHSTYGYQNVNGLQIAYTGDYDSDADGLPDGWEMKWLDSLGYAATDDLDSDGLNNLREYKLGLDPMRYDSDADGIADGQDSMFPGMEDTSPQGCYQYTSGGDNWNWVTSWSDGIGWSGGTVYPQSGQKMRVSANTTNTIHQHYFERGVSVIRPGTGEVLYAYVNLDPTKPPTEVMLQFQTLGNNGAYGREYRAYWGANNIAYGTDGTVSRTNMGALPATGQWVRLQVPASAVGLECKIIEGINFTLYSGRAAWDSAGVVVPDMDGDGVADIDADGLPDPWELEHFGDLTQSGDGDYDNDGVNNLAEHNAGSDPNTIQFYTLFTDLRVSGNTATGAVTVLGGVPAKIALLVDSSDFGSAMWSNYTASFTASLGSTDGSHEVFVGLKGRATDSQATWVGYRLTRDTEAPQIVISSPAPGVVFQPLMQLQGYSPEPLASVRYDATNAAGSLTNLEGYVVKQFVDTNTLEITTNWFACVDVRLTNGANTITLRCTDRAGNVSTTNLEYNFALPTNAPTLQLWWPQNGAKVGGPSFMVRGWLSDATAAVAAEIVGGGTTNVAEGVVERDGKFWLGNLPLADGTNTVSLSAVDVSTNTTLTNFVVVKSEVELTITPLADSVLNDPFVTVYGTFNGSDHKIWVNGVEVTNINGQDWYVEGVPLPAGGTAFVQARAIPTSDQGGNGTGGSGGLNATYENPGNPDSPEATTADAEKDEPAVVVATYYNKILLDVTWLLNPETLETNLTTTESTDILWATNTAGHDAYAYCEQALVGQYFVWTEACWDTNGYGVEVGAITHECGLKEPQGWIPYAAPTVWPGEFCEVFKAGRRDPDPQIIRYRQRDRLALTLYQLRTGGKAQSNRKNLFVVAGGAEGVGNPFWWEVDLEDKKEYVIPNTSVVLGDLGRLGSDGTVYRALADGVTRDVTPTVAGNPYYRYDQPFAGKLTMQLSSVTFYATNNTYYDVLLDTNGAVYPKPHWWTNETDHTVQSSPALFVSGARVQTHDTAFSVKREGYGPDTTLVVRGEASGGSTSFTLWGTNVISGVPTSWGLDTTADAVLTANKADFFNPLTIKWSYAVPGRTDFLDTGTSTNQVYVTWRSPTNGVTLYRTVVHLACSHLGATTADAAVANTWSLFDGPANVETWDGIALKYYGTASGGSVMSTAGLLTSHEGQCSAFANLLMDALKANGIADARFTKVLPANGTIRFGVTNINFDDANPAFPTETYWKYSEDDLDINAAGIAGQNMGTPKEKRFQNHWLVHRGTYYDPSYGKTTTGNTAFNDNIVAWKRDDGKWRKAAGSTYVVTFGVDVDEAP